MHRFVWKISDQSDRASWDIERSDIQAPIIVATLCPAEDFSDLVRRSVAGVHCRLSWQSRQDLKALLFCSIVDGINNIGREWYIDYDIQATFKA